jgi:hypothetical protein
MGSMGMACRSMAVAVALSGAGCSNPSTGIDVGNGAAVAINLRGYEAPPAPKPQGLTLSSGVRVDACWMGVERLRLRPGSDCSGGDAETDVVGPLVAEIVEVGILGGAARYTVPAGPFCRFVLRFHVIRDKELPAGAPSVLADRSIVVQGARADGTPFTVASGRNDALSLDAKGGSFELEAGEHGLFVAFELGAAVAALDLGGATGDTIDDKSEPERLAAFEAALTDAARLFRDADADGKLSASESSPGAELAQ